MIPAWTWRGNTNMLHTERSRPGVEPEHLLL
uniref:Uncharacterized protein n=1 Tax=Anguilla anguilla TaxID=7936 RepID=A0A0E9XNW1_ANGAN